jgi:hypothetical protein
MNWTPGRIRFRNALIAVAPWAFSAGLRTLFWLDGHFSGGITAQGEVSTPICDEVLAVAKQCPVRFVVLIDDARSFGSEVGYPSPDQFREQISAWLPGAIVSVENDIIAIVPAEK